MNNNDFLKILSILRAAYPNSYKDMTKTDVRSLINLWTKVMGDYDYQTVENAINCLVCTNTYPPTIADIKRQLCGEIENEDMSEMEAWSLVQKALTNSNYNSEGEYNKLPNIVKKCVGSPNMLKEWCQMPTDKVQSVVQSNFMRAYRIKQSAASKHKLFAPKVEEMLDKSHMKMLED